MGVTRSPPCDVQRSATVGFFARLVTIALSSMSSSEDCAVGVADLDLVEHGLRARGGGIDEAAVGDARAGEGLDHRVADRDMELGLDDPVPAGLGSYRSRGRPAGNRRCRVGLTARPGGRGKRQLNLVRTHRQIASVAPRHREGAVVVVLGELERAEQLRAGAGGDVGGS